ncbi:MAG: hypothetical protein F6K65_12630 [Moorea sp. SIO3C2]|nr:hypothetical protein [Moorena sp. SIO3C2]
MPNTEAAITSLDNDPKSFTQIGLLDANGIVGVVRSVVGESITERLR